MKTNISLLIEQSINIIDYSFQEFRFSREEQKLLCNYFKPFEIKKNEFIIKIGDLEKYIYFIEKGALRYWTQINEENTEKEISFWFSLPGEFASSYFSFKYNRPSAINIQALAKSYIWKINKQNFLSLSEYSSNISKIIRVVLEDLLIRRMNHEIDLLGLSGEEKYQKILRQNKELIENVPLKYLASYIALTPQRLSHLRKR